MERELLEIISENPAVSRFLHAEGRLVVQDPLALSYLVAAAFLRKRQRIALIADNLYTAQNLYEQISSILGEENCLLFPMDDIFHETNYAYSREMTAQRLYVMNRCLENRDRILITHLSAAGRYLPAPELYRRYTLHLATGESYSLQEIVQRLAEMSFTRVNKVDQSLQFALRGDILDIFPINSERPVRVEFFDDTIESIRYFDIASQLSDEVIGALEIFPSTDLLVEKDSFSYGKETVLKKLDEDIKGLRPEIRETLIRTVHRDIGLMEVQGFSDSFYKYFRLYQRETHTIFDYFRSAVTVLLNANELQSSAQLREEETGAYIEELYKNGLSLRFFSLTAPLELALKQSAAVIPAYPFFDSGETDYFLDVRSIPFFSRNLANSIALIEEYQKKGDKVILCLESDAFETYRTFLSDHQIAFEILQKNRIPEGSIGMCPYDLTDGFELVREKLVFLGKREIFGYKQNLTVFSSRYKKATILNSFEELEPGDYIVHEENGIGRYEGAVTLTANGQIGDYLKILYANDQILYIPLQKFSSIRKYVSREGVVPRLSRIGGKDWAHTKEKIREQVDFLAERLIQLYAKRETTPGYAFRKDDEFQQAFEAAFPYPLTPDQKQAVREIKEDMEKPFPMDRLLCGDVGFGKTEVAFRAAFKAILSGKQVALLCPTTILAKQHFDVALSRFAMFGVQIALFSRFVPEKRQQQYIRDIHEKKIHLIIGTHRLLSREIIIPDLGLLIVDEEQRFGVEHKERIKEMSAHVDVLTLTATPIPRTLQMSLIGIRNLSQLQTPPNSRMPIQTYVLPYDARVAKEAIARELSRGGQIFYLHNRVSSIYQKATRLQEALPKARIGVVHAKMDKEDIDEIMTRFYLGETDVLVCTSIVEAGLDIPNANTIIVEEADLFGLSQLYQIKGRVGRSNRVAYAYLFYNGRKELNDQADKRLQAIREFTELGSGFKIAQKDLNIRGAGDILGSEQSGFIDTVGMDMYVSILNEVVREKRGLPQKKNRLRPTNITVGGYIPSSYALDSDKIQLYQEIEACNTLPALEILRRKIRDIFGRLPKEVEKILLKRKIDILASSENIESVVEEDTIVITLTKELSMSNGFATRLGEKLSMLKDSLRVSFKDKKFILRIIKDKAAVEHLLTVLSVINALSAEPGRIG